MTRGQLVFIDCDGKVYTSTEFNGDMYLEGYGHQCIDLLEDCNTLEQFREKVKQFAIGYGYDEEDDFEIYPAVKCSTSEGTVLDFQTDYFEDWFSDYLYVKNASKKPVKVLYRKTAKNGKLQPGTVGVYNFGEEFSREDADGV